MRLSFFTAMTSCSDIQLHNHTHFNDSLKDIGLMIKDIPQLRKYCTVYSLPVISLNDVFVLYNNCLILISEDDISGIPGSI